MVNEIIVGVILGAIVGLIIGFGLELFRKHLEESRTKKYICKAILSEIKLNQSRLQDYAKAGAGFRKIAETREVKGSADEETKDLFKKAITKGGYDIKLPPDISFDITIYSNISHELGLLNTEIRDKIISYYGGLNLMSFILRYLSEISKLSEKNGYLPQVKKLIERTKTKEIYDKAEECFNIGVELIEKLNKIEVTKIKKK